MVLMATQGTMSLAVRSEQGSRGERLQSSIAIVIDEGRGVNVRVNVEMNINDVVGAKKPSIYLIDDHAIIRMGLRALLGQVGYTVVGEAANLMQALEEVSSSKPDVALLGLHPSGRNGMEFLTDLQIRCGSTRVLVLSMSAQHEDISGALRAGASGYLLKGASATELTAAIDVVAEGRRYLGNGMRDIDLTKSAGDPDDGELLSSRERQILVMVAVGKTSAAIARELEISPKTVETYRVRLMRKLKLPNVPAIVRWAVRERLIDL